ncbi:MAG: glycosyltransferase family 1 protein [Sphingobacteriales bacterium]|nr:MAG: glycosyltransferase family 1 protein [Sphingobacteriales bacterium]
MPTPSPQKKTILQNNAQLIDDKKITIIYNRIDVDALLQKEWHPFYHKQNGELVLAHAGRLSFEKNQSFLIDLAVKLKEQGLAFKIILAGTGKDEAMLKEKANSMQVKDHIIFAGFVSNVMDIINSCDIFVLPSLWEGFGYVLAEAALAEKPVVAFNLTSIPEIVLHKKTGLLTPKNDPDDFVSCIIQLAADAQLRAEYGRNGRKHVEATFSSAVIDRQLIAYLSQ